MQRDLTILLTLAAFLQDQLKNELIAQKHVATGELVESIDVITESLPSLVEIRGESLEYGGYVNRGRLAKAKRVPIEALEQWIQVVGFGVAQGRETKSLAFAIQHSIYEKGIPAKPYVEWTEGNLIERTGWVDKVLERNEGRIIQDVIFWFERNIEIIIENFAKKYGSQAGM